MPDSRPLPPRQGEYDDPPAESSTPYSRRQRLRRAILGTNELAQDVIHMANADRLGRRSTPGRVTRRRQRSSSEQEEASASTPEGGHVVSRRSAKRRRLDNPREPPTKQALKYGYYGQVAAGRLQLDLLSCDGGQHYDHRHPDKSLGPHNLLRHDKNVYCSEHPQSNMILKHADDTPFCLEKLHIIGPENGFTAPVRAGVVHVAMNLTDLQKYVDPKKPEVPTHARLSRQNPRRAQRRRPADRSSSPPGLLTVAEALRDPYINAARSHPADQLSDEETDPDAEADVYCDSNPTTNPRTWQNDPHSNTFIRRTQPVTILSDEDAGPEESSPQDVLDYRSQRERLMRRRYDIENWHRREAGAGRDDPTADYSRDHDRDGVATIPLARLLAHARERDREREAQAVPTVARASPSSSSDNDSFPPLEPITPPADPSPLVDGPYCPMTGLHLPSLNTNSTSTDDDDGVTTARFRLARDRYRVAIRFEPPVSGRFMLLKLWADEGPEKRERNSGANVDVQSVVATGWMGGLRFFPSVEMK